MGVDNREMVFKNAKMNAWQRHVAAATRVTSELVPSLLSLNSSLIPK